FPVSYETGDRPTDALLGLRCLKGPRGIGHLVRPEAYADGSAVYATKHPLSLEDIQVPSNRHLRAAQLGRQLAYGDLVSISDRHGQRLTARSHIHSVNSITYIVQMLGWTRWAGVSACSSAIGSWSGSGAAWSGRGKAMGGAGGGRAGGDRQDRVGGGRPGGGRVPGFPGAASARR